MNTDLAKRLLLVSGSFFFVGGCIVLIFFTVFLTITIQLSKVGIGEIVGLIFTFSFIVILFYKSIDAFIKYGMSKGIDYSIEKQNTMTMQEVNNSTDEIVKNV